MNTINDMLGHGKRRQTGAGDVLTRVKVHKGVGSLDVSGGDDNDSTNSTLSCDGVIAFLGGLHVRTELDSTMFVEVQNAARDDAFGDDGVGHPIFRGDRVIKNTATVTRPIVSALGSLLNGVPEKPAQQLYLMVRTKRSDSWT